jgi:hypothetical protein
MMNLAPKHLNYLLSLILGGFIPGQVDAVPAETTTVAAREHVEKIVSKNYNESRLPSHNESDGIEASVYHGYKVRTTSKGVEKGHYLRIP